MRVGDYERKNFSVKDEGAGAYFNRVHLKTVKKERAARQGGERSPKELF